MALVVVAASSSQAQAAPAERAPEVGHVAASPILGTVLASEIGGSRAKEEQSLATVPVGMHVFKTVAEIEEPVDAVEPGATVDVGLAILGNEGPESTRILRNIRVYSVGQLEHADAKLSTEPETQAERVPPVRVVGLIVNARQLETLRVAEAQGIVRLKVADGEVARNVFGQIWHNFTANLFQPLLLFFFLGFAVPLLKVPFEFPKVLYQSLTIYLLIAIGWHGGELMAQQSSSELAIAAGLVVVGFCINGLIGVAATYLLRWFTPMRRIDAVTVGAYYGSDSAGTFVTCLGILATLSILHDSYMPVMLAAMEIPGCLVGLFLVSRLRAQGMDRQGNMPGEPGYQAEPRKKLASEQESAEEMMEAGEEEASASGQLHNGSGHTQVAVAPVRTTTRPVSAPQKHPVFSWKIAHEVFLNPGLFLLFGGLIVGFISGLQALEDPHVVEGPDHLFIFIFKGALCLFLLEMGMTACRRLRDLKTAGWGFIAFGLLAPNLFALVGILALHAYSMALGHTFYLGTYALFAVLCAAASYIAVPAVQRIAIPEASPTLPLAASLGLTFTWNVTLGIPIYIEIAKAVIAFIPVA